MDNPLISVVIPTIDGRENWLRRCETAYRQYTPSVEIIVVRNEPSCGHAWQKGYEQSHGKYVHFTADDITPHADWWQKAIDATDADMIPVCWVEAPDGTRQYCDSPLGVMGMYPNVLVPFLSRAQLEEGGWLLPIHYGSDDWITYLAVTRRKTMWPCPAYRVTHHVASEGRDYMRRHSDVATLVEHMREQGYVPPVYEQLEKNLRTSTTGLDAVRIRQLDERERINIRAQRKLPQEHDVPMRIMASQFKNEVDVLEIKLETVGHLFDKIVIAEATADQRGQSRELVFPKHSERFAAWNDKIRYIVVDDMPEGTEHEDDVKRERHQRDALQRGMPELGPDDLVYVSDLDEIPYPDALQAALEKGESVRFPMDLYVYALNWRWLDRGCRIGTLGALVLGRDIQDKGVCGAVLWDQNVKGLPDVSGWHLTYQGGVESIRSKITGMMDKHVNLVMPGVDSDSILEPSWIRESIDTGRDVFGRTYRPTEWVGLDQLPPIVAANPERYAHMLVPRPDNQDAVEAELRCTCGGRFEGTVLMHFPYCRLAEVPETLIYPADERDRPRAKDV